MQAVKKEQLIDTCDHRKNEKFLSCSDRLMKLELLFDKQAERIKKQEKNTSEMIKSFEEQKKRLQMSFEEQSQKLQILEEQNKKLQDRLTAIEGDVTGNSDIEWLSKEQNAKISNILKQTTGWRKALSKILVIVFSKETLSQSCSVGKKNAKHKPLDVMKLDVIKSMYVFIALYTNQDLQ